MIFLKYFTLALILLNLPTFGVYAFGSTVGSLLSALLFSSIILYFFLSKKEAPPLIFILIGVSYFLISGFNYIGDTRDYFIDVIKFFIFILGGTSLIKDTSSKELGVFMLIGTISVIINAVLFSTDYGRYGGLYLNPNRAGLTCLAAFSLSFTIKHRITKLGLQLIIVIAGIMTLSRYFILLLVIINLIAISSNIKNGIGLLAGSFGVVLILALSSVLQLNTERFDAFKSLFNSDHVETETISRGSRTETWALYTDVILENVVTGKGYKTLHGRDYNTVGVQTGVHNTYLLVLGEAGFIVFLMFIFCYTSLFLKSLKFLKINIEYVCLAFILMTFLLVSHNFFDNYLLLFLSIWLYRLVSKATTESIYSENSNIHTEN
ncbi:O-antigen ligase family protein [Xanthomarina sp. F1114]|uniref:O-antigen ligase family protein n=1 Tax=Xanthomarina sp. F1114 TaxID=2996019 RepID=UPI00225E1624|nr:O-antigen ligase family protein [Xanthomarina sp. F1114]MCX7548391.1 O-antigen ligase family protein [Xanthomarina sp. F1114]